MATSVRHPFLPWRVIYKEGGILLADRWPPVSYVSVFFVFRAREHICSLFFCMPSAHREACLSPVLEQVYSTAITIRAVPFHLPEEKLLLQYHGNLRRSRSNRHETDRPIFKFSHPPSSTTNPPPAAPNLKRTEVRCGHHRPRPTAKRGCAEERRPKPRYRAAAPCLPLAEAPRVQPPGHF